MGVVISTAGGAIALPATSKSYPAGGGVVSRNRAPTDALYYADVSVQNIVIGSRWLLGYDDAGTFTTLDSGEAAATSFTIANVPSYASSFLLELRVRKSSAAPKYIPVKQYSYHAQAGIVMYVSQVLDGVAA